MIGTDFLRPVHRQDDLVRKPVRHEVGDDGEHEPEHQALRAAERLAEKQKQGAQRAQQERRLDVLAMDAILASTVRDADSARIGFIVAGGEPL